jgi:thiol-disulfide isomerase/thioredoxin
MTRISGFRLAVTLGAIGLGLASGVGVVARVQQTPPPTATPTAARPPAEDIGFPSVDSWRLSTPDLTDAQVADLLATLDRLLSRGTDPATWKSEAALHFWRFQNRLERGRTTAGQRATIARHFDQLAAAYPAHKALVDHRKWMALNIGVGLPAPDIAGKDLDGVPFSLGEHKGKVVSLVFTGEWCGPCRSEYPYQRLMLELYKDRPFALLGVNSDAKVETARQGKIDAKLPYRSWWDGFEKESTKGPIATAWGVTGWPTTYLIDAAGVIRFAGARHEDSLKALAQLMEEMARAK